MLAGHLSISVQSSRPMSQELRNLGWRLRPGSCLQVDEATRQDETCERENTKAKAGISV